MRQWQRQVALAPATLMLLALAGCGSKHALVSVNVSPAAGSATHASAQDTVTFTAKGNYATYDTGYYDQYATAFCLVGTYDNTRPVPATWSTSDTVNTTIDANGMAKCLSPTPAPATITAIAKGVCGGVKATAILNCN